jgi:hypothetical protein
MAQRATVRKSVELAEENVNWFYETYGDISNNASLSWVLDLMLTEFRKAHDKTPQELAAIGAAELKKLLAEKAS